MKQSLLFAVLFGSALFASPSLKEIEEQNKMLEAQIKQEELKQKLQKLQKASLTPPPIQSDNSTLEETSENIDLTYNPHTSLMLGIGLGVTQGEMYGIIDNELKDINLDSYGAFSLSTQIGGLTMFNNYFGLEYYYNLDVMFDDSMKNKDTSTTLAINSAIITQNLHFDVFGILSTSTLNTNLVVNAYHSEDFAFGFIAGLGLGVDISRYKGSYSGTLSDQYVTAKISEQTMDYLGVSFDMRANVGARFLINKNFVLNLNFAFPFFVNIIDPSTAVKDNVAFSARFAYLLF